MLANGDYLLPVYHETGFDQEKVGADSTSLFLRFSPKNQKMDRERAGSARGWATFSRPWCNDDKDLVAYCRPRRQL